MSLIQQSVMYGIALWVHLVCVVTAVGGPIVMRYFLMPAANELEEGPRARLIESVRRGMFKVIPIAIGLLIISGIFNLYRALTVGATVPRQYHMVFGIKMMLAFLMFTIALGLVWPSRPANMFQRNRRVWVTMNAHLGLLIIALSVALKFLSGK